MSVTQTAPISIGVDIPASRRLTIDVPREVPVGRTILVFTPAPDIRSAKQGAGDRKADTENTDEVTSPHPHSDALFAIFSQIRGDIDPDTIRMERLAKHLP